MRLSDFHFDLPDTLIAQEPVSQRDRSRLLVLERATGALRHQTFTDFVNYLRPGDLLVLNNSKVIPARLRGIKPGSGGQVEFLLYRESAKNTWWAMAKPGKRLRPGSQIGLIDRQGGSTGITAEVLDKDAEGRCHLVFRGADDIKSELNQLGEIPLPPYIARPEGANANDYERYQTVFGKVEGSVAAPTAGLHFTEAILEQIRKVGVNLCEVTLHVGLGTFSPVKVENLRDHNMHAEYYEISEDAALKISQARACGSRIIAVGTTSLRVLESAQTKGTTLEAGAGNTRLFVYPPYTFKMVDALLTNFHLPESTLLMLVSAFASPGDAKGRSLILEAYREAINNNYRFFSYGDAMFIY